MEITKYVEYQIQEIVPKSEPDIFYSTKEVKALLDPLIELNGIGWLSEHTGASTNIIRQTLKQKTVTMRKLDKWLTKLGIVQAFYDGSLTPITIPEPPPTKFYEE